MIHPKLNCSLEQWASVRTMNQEKLSLEEWTTRLANVLDFLLEQFKPDRFILSGGINLELISSIKKLKNQLPNLIGVEINSKFEIKPGLKDINRVKKFIKSIKNENT